jgi:hypothetical protein
MRSVPEPVRKTRRAAGSLAPGSYTAGAAKFQQTYSAVRSVTLTIVNPPPEIGETAAGAGAFSER